MAQNSTPGTPQSPEVESPRVREELHQTGVSHEGDPQTPTTGGPSQHLGATDEEMTPVRAPMRGPENLVGPTGRRGGRGGRADDPPDRPAADEITPGEARRLPAPRGRARGRGPSRAARACARV